MALGDPYVTEADLADYLKMSVTGNEPELDMAVRAASRWVEGWCRRQFNLADEATARLFDTTNTGVLYVDDIGDVTDLAIATDSAQDGSYTTAWAGTDYQLGPLDAVSQGRPFERITAVGSYTYPLSVTRMGLVRVTAAWGWPSVPDAVKQATLIHAAKVYKRRESAEGVLGFNEFGPVRVGARVDPDVELLLQDFTLAAAIV